MNKYIIYIALLLCFNNRVSAQSETPNADTIKLNEVVVYANKVPVPLKTNPGSVSIVTPAMLSNLPKSIAAEEALRLVPGVRIDNQHGGERVHLSIRGQGILTERGLRGIGVFIDGFPLNDPSGFAPDLYDVDWATVKKIEVLRGPAAGLYGGCSSGGVLNIYTKDGGAKPFGGEVSETLGSHGFMKSRIQLDGSQGTVDYRIGFSRTDGDGYRDHQAFWSNKLYEKINFHPSEKLSITQIVSHTDYFHQNPEGLNRGQFDDLTQANPDARPFNEYQKTNRTLIGGHGSYKFNEMNDVEATSYLRSWDYKETSNKCAEYRNIINIGANVQYNLHLNSEKMKNNFSLGADYEYQDIDMYKLESAADPNRIESIDETNIETDSLLANQIISQHNAGIFAIYKLEVGKLIFMSSARYDHIENELTDKMLAGDSAFTSTKINKPSVRLGISYDFGNALTLFSNWAQGFIPPSTEELASNPEGFSGFNTHLVPATSTSLDLGGRGFLGEKMYYEITGFWMNTENDFFRFKQSGRGNQEVFYGNAGNSIRVGIETYISCKLLENLDIQLAYTFADYKYTSATVDPVYTDSAYVLTTPPDEGQYLPNSPQHQLYAEAACAITRNLTLSIGTEFQSKWAIYTDAKAYNGELDPALYQNWQDGFILIHTRIAYRFKLWKLQGECSVFVRNSTNEQYMAFTEPDPDGNSYQPGPGREIFGNIMIRF